MIRDLLTGAAALLAATALSVHFFLPAPSRSVLGSEEAANPESTPDNEAITVAEKTSDINIRFTFDGVAADKITTVRPIISLSRKGNEKWTRRNSPFNWQNSVATLFDIPADNIWVTARFNAEGRNPDGYPGDYIAEGYLNIHPRVRDYDLRMRKFLHLTSPVDNDRTLGRYISGCGQAAHKSPITFSWQRVTEHDTYEVRVYRGQCKPFKTGMMMYSERIGANELTLKLDPSGENDFYFFEVTAFTGNGEVSKLALHGEGWTSWEHRFKVN